MFGWRKKDKMVEALTVETGAPIDVPIEMMNAVYDRSAGRWCGACKQHGSHHTDRHDEFAQVAIDRAHSILAGEN